MLRYSDKVALITGAASKIGVGFATARKLAEEGARVFISDINAGNVAARAAELREAGFAVQAAGHDVTSESQWSDVVAQCVAAYGQLDVLVNNAAIVEMKPIEETTEESWDRQVNSILKGTFLGCKAALHQMRKQGTGGAVVNIGSVVSIIGSPSTSAYSSGKAGVRILTKSVALECAADRIRVNCLMPGAVRTDMYNATADQVPDDFLTMVPMRRPAEPSEIASVVAFLGSDDASFMTGAEVVVDGGQTAQ